MPARKATPWPWILSGALHATGALVAAWWRPPPRVPEVTLTPLAEVDLTVVEPPPAPEPPQPAPPPAPPEPSAATTATPPPAARALPRRGATTATANPAPEGPSGPTGPEAPSAPGPISAPGPAQPAPPAPSLRAADILRASNDATLRGASEGGWSLPPAGGHGPRDIFGGGRGPCTTPECLAAIASAPAREGLAANPRDHRPAGSGRADVATARRAVEELNLVREVPGIGRAVARAPLHTVPGQRRTVGAGEGGVAEEFDTRHGSSFAGMTFGASTPDIRYHLLRVELDVVQDPAGAIRSIQISRASGFEALDLAATRALREALGDNTWSAGTTRWSRWRLEVSDAATVTPFTSNDGWTVYGEPSEGTRVRVRMRVIAQRVMDGRDAGV